MLILDDNVSALFKLILFSYMKRVYIEFNSHVLPAHLEMFFINNLLDKMLQIIREIIW